MNGILNMVGLVKRMPGFIVSALLSFMLVSLSINLQSEETVAESIIPALDTSSDSLKQHDGAEENLSFIKAQVIKDSLYLVEKDPLYFRKITTRLVVEIEADSSVGNIYVIESEPYYDSLAVKIARTWKYIPAFRDGLPFQSNLPVTVDFYKAKSGVEKERQAGIVKKEDLDSLLTLYSEIDDRTALLYKKTYYSENHHSYFPVWDIRNFEINGFTESSPGVSALLYKYALYNQVFDYSEDLIHAEFSQREYDFPVLLSTLELGLGSNSMNYAKIALQKNKTFGKEGFSSYLTVITQEGSLFRQNEKGTNFTAGFNYKLGKCALKSDYLKINQKLTEDYTSNGDELEDIDITSISMIIENPFLNAGYKYQEEKYKNEKVDFDYYTLLFFKELSLFENEIQAKFERIYVNDDPVNKYSIDHNFCSDFFRSDNSYYNYNDEQNWSTCDYFIYRKFIAGAVYTQEDFIADESYYLEKKTVAGLAGYSGDSFSCRVLSGKKVLTSSEKSEGNFVKCESDLDLSIKYFNIKFSSVVDYQKFSDDIYEPSIQVISKLTFVFSLKYGNYLSLGLQSNYHDAVTNFISDSQNDSSLLMEFFAGLRVTSHFQIQMDLENINNTEDFLGRELNGLHANFYIKWYFLN